MQLPAMTAAGAAAVGLFAEGGASLTALAGSGASSVALAASGGAQLPGVDGSGTASVALEAGGDAVEFITLEASGLATALPLSAAGAWFRVANASDAGSGLAFTLPNELSTNHATTTTDARKPTISTSPNGLPMLVCNASALRVALHAAINSSTKFWFAFHARITSAAGNPVPFSIDSAGGGGASTRKLFAQRFGGDLAHVHSASSPTTLARSFGAATIWQLNTWRHYICEINLDLESSPGVLAPEADRALWCVDGVPITSTFANSVGAPGVLPSAMATPTGFMHLFAQNASTGGNGWVGEIGANIIAGAAAMAGVSRGCLTSAARLTLSGFERNG